MAEKVPVKKGDTLSTIAKAKGTTVAQILADNPVLKARADAGQTVLYSGTNVKIQWEMDKHIADISKNETHWIYWIPSTLITAVLSSKD